MMDAKKGKKTSSAGSSADDSRLSEQRLDAWERLRGALKDVYAELGGGEAYLRNERDNFDQRREGK